MSRTDFNTIVVNNLKEYMDKSGLSIHEIAKKSDLTAPAICRYKSENRTPNLYNAYKIARTLGITLDELCKNVDETI